MDGLTGFPKGLQAINLKTEVQFCVAHQIHNSLRYVDSKYHKTFIADLKPVYQAPIEDAVESALAKLEQAWGDKYPTVIQSWHIKLDNLSVYFRYPELIRKMIDTTISI